MCNTRRRSSNFNDCASLWSSSDLGFSDLLCKSMIEIQLEVASHWFFNRMFTCIRGLCWSKLCSTSWQLLVIQGIYPLLFKDLCNIPDRWLLLLSPWFRRSAQICLTFVLTVSTSPNSLLAFRWWGGDTICSQTHSSAAPMSVSILASEEDVTLWNKGLIRDLINN